jgi:SAM-dependent methyltransferase
MTSEIRYSAPIRWLRRYYHVGRYKIVAAQLHPGSLLDIGAGRPCETMPDMSFLRYLNRPDAVGMDIRPLTGPFKSVVGSILKIPFPDHSFDNIVAMEVIEHVDDVAGALDEVRRVLKPGGTFIMTTPDCTPVFVALWSLWTRHVGKMWQDAHVAAFRLDYWRWNLESRFQHVRWTRHWHWVSVTFRATNGDPS